MDSKTINLPIDDSINFEYVHNRIVQQLEIAVSSEESLLYHQNEVQIEKSKIKSFILNFGMRHKELLKKNSLIENLSRKIKKKLFSTKSGYCDLASIDELTTYDSIDFVYAVFRTILKRDPDPNGLNYYINLLNQGTPKEIIIYKIYSSKEAKTSRSIEMVFPSSIKQRYAKFRAKQIFKKTPVFWIYRLIILPSSLNKLHEDLGIYFTGNEYKRNIHQSSLNKEIQLLNDQLLQLQIENSRYKKRINELSQAISNIDRKVNALPEMLHQLNDKLDEINLKQK